MSKLLFIGLLLIILHFRAVSQTDPDSIIRRHQIDSLKHKIENAKEDTNLIKNLGLLSEHYRFVCPDTASMFARRIIKIEEKLKYPLERIVGFSSFCGLFYAHKNYDSCIYYMQKGLEVCIAHHFYNEENEYRRSLNNVYFLKGDYTRAMKVSTEGLASAEKINDEKWMSHYNNVLGFIMMKLQNFELSRRYFSAHLRLARQIKDKWEEAHALLNLADLFIAEKKIKEAIPFINSALHIYQTDLPPVLVFGKQAYTYNKLGEAYNIMDEKDSSLKYSLLTIGFIKKHEIGNNLYDVATYYINAGDIYNRLNQPDSALFYLRHGLTIAQKIKHREIMRDAYEKLSVSFALEKRFDSAYSYLQSFSKLKDSILNENSERDILQKEAGLQMERQRRVQQAELSHQQLWRNVIIGISIITILIVILLYNRRRIKQQILYQRQLNKQQNEMFNLTDSVQEKERKRIAEDIHDGLGSVLSAAKLKLSALENKESLTEEQRERYFATLSLLDEAAAELRNISHNIMPATLSKLGLIAALKNITDRISSHSGLQIQFEAHGFVRKDSPGDNRLEESAEISIYRIVLELLNNIVKHAQASKTVVQLIKYPDYINITVEDNGKGFDYKKTINLNKGIGLGNIESRVNYLKGTIDVDSLPGRGTVTIIDIPYTTQSLKYQDIGIKET